MMMLPCEKTRSMYADIAGILYSQENSGLSELYSALAKTLGLWFASESLRLIAVMY